MGGRRWIEEEGKRLRGLYFEGSKESILRALPNRTWSSIKQHALLLGLERQRRSTGWKWSEEEDRRLEELWPEGSDEELGMAFPNRSRTSLQIHARKLGLSRPRLEDLSGRRFGTRVVMKRAKDLAGHSSRWHYQCKECAKRGITDSYSLKNGRSCECGVRKKASERNTADLTGLTFEWLTALEHRGSAKGWNAIWLCECKCGNRIEALACNLKSGNSTSCGCRGAYPTRKGDWVKSKPEQVTANGFSLANIPYEYEPERFEVDGGHYLPDFLIPDPPEWLIVGLQEMGKEVQTGEPLWLEIKLGRRRYVQNIPKARAWGKTRNFTIIGYENSSEVGMLVGLVEAHQPSLVEAMELWKPDW